MFPIGYHNVLILSSYEEGDIRQDDVCVGSPTKNKRVLAKSESILGGPLICINNTTPVFTGIVSRNSKSINEGYPGLFSNIFKLRSVFNFYEWL